MLLDLTEVSARLFELYGKSREGWVQKSSFWKKFRDYIVIIRFNLLNLHFLLLLKISYIPQPDDNRYNLKPVEDLNTAWLERQCSFYGQLRDSGVVSTEKVPDLERFEVLKGGELGLERFEVARKFLQIYYIVGLLLLSNLLLVKLSHWGFKLAYFVIIIDDFTVLGRQ